MKKRSKNKKFRLIGYILLFGLAYKLFKLLGGGKNNNLKKNFCEFLEQEKREVKELKNGEESLAEYCADSACLFKDYFIPSRSNGHKPKILRTKSLAVIIILLAVVKFSVTGYLYFVYPNQAKMSEEITARVLELVNQDRAANNLAPLHRDRILNASALAKAEDMAINNYFSHYSPGGRKPWDWISRGDYPYLFVGENLAINFTSAESVHKALMNSPTHKKNILNEKYQDVGLAMISGEIDGKRTNILVQLFAIKQAPKIAVNTEPNLSAGATKQVIAEPDTAQDVVKSNDEAKVLASQAASSEPKGRPDEAGVNTGDNSNKAETGGEKPAQEDSESEREEYAAPGSASAETEAESKPRVIMYGQGEKTASPEIGPADNFNRITFYASLKQDQTLPEKISLASKYLFAFALAGLVILLLINIFVRIRVQHKPVIAQTVFAIIFIIGLYSARLHIIEQISDQIAML